MTFSKRSYNKPDHFNSVEAAALAYNQLKPSETMRVHVKRNGHVVAMPTEMTISHYPVAR